MRTRIVLASALIVASAAAAACDRTGDNADDEPRTVASGLPLVEVRYDGGTLLVELARTSQERVAGLSDRDSLAPDSGMLFDLGRTRIPQFWMKDTRIPLDMVWIDEERRIDSVTANVQPQPGVANAELRLYSPAVPVRYVLELNAGAAQRLGLGPGIQLDFDADVP